jgi:predicted enzyme related to lactoylglutathione lyase
MLSAKKLTGLIMTSPDPARAAAFYRDVIGIPYQLSQHGNLPPHYECDVDGVHFAVIRGPARPEGSLTASFEVEDLDAFLARLEVRGILPKHKTMELGGGPRISTIVDPDGNDVRLYATH